MGACTMEFDKLHEVVSDYQQPDFAKGTSSFYYTVLMHWTLMDLERSIGR
jgi:hypothetical protein